MTIEYGREGNNENKKFHSLFSLFPLQNPKKQEIN